MKTVSVGLGLLASIGLGSAQGNERVGQEADVLQLDASSFSAEEMAELRGGLMLPFDFGNLLSLRAGFPIDSLIDVKAARTTVRVLAIPKNFIVVIPL